MAIGDPTEKFDLETEYIEDYERAWKTADGDWQALRAFRPSGGMSVAKPVYEASALDASGDITFEVDGRDIYLHPAVRSDGSSFIRQGNQHIAYHLPADLRRRGAVDTPQGEVVQEVTETGSVRLRPVLPSDFEAKVQWEEKIRENRESRVKEYKRLYNGQLLKNIEDHLDLPLEEMGFSHGAVRQCRIYDDEVTTQRTLRRRRVNIPQLFAAYFDLLTVVPQSERYDYGWIETDEGTFIVGEYIEEQGVQFIEDTEKHKNHDGFVVKARFESLPDVCLDSTIRLTLDTEHDAIRIDPPLAFFDRLEK